MKLLLPVMLGGLLYSGGIGAQPAPAPQSLTLVQAERRAVELKQGMTLREVQDLLGEPKRTALKTLSHAATPELWQSALRWTYAWPGPSLSDRTLHWTYACAGPSLSDRSLEVVFASSKAPGRWLVQSWDWNGY